MPETITVNLRPSFLNISLVFTTLIAKSAVAVEYTVCIYA